MATSGKKLPASVEQVVCTEALGVDLRTVKGRRWRDAIRGLASQLNNEVTTSQGALLRSCATLMMFMEASEARLLSGQSVDQVAYVRNGNALQATLLKLGLAKQSRDTRVSDNQPEDQHALALFGTG